MARTKKSTKTTAAPPVDERVVAVTASAEEAPAETPVETPAAADAPVETVEETPAAADVPVETVPTPSVGVPVSDRAMAYVTTAVGNHFGDSLTPAMLAEVRRGLAAGKTVVALRHPFEVIVTAKSASEADSCKQDFPGRALFNISRSLVGAKLYSL